MIFILKNTKIIIISKMSEGIMNGLIFELFLLLFSFFVDVCSVFQAENNSLQGSKRNALKPGLHLPGVFTVIMCWEGYEPQTIIYRALPCGCGGWVLLRGVMCYFFLPRATEIVSEMQHSGCLEQACVSWVALSLWRALLFKLRKTLWGYVLF